MNFKKILCALLVCAVTLGICHAPSLRAQETDTKTITIFYPPWTKKTIHKVNQEVTITANKFDTAIFNNWGYPDGITLTDDQRRSETLEFTMPNNHITFRPIYDDAYAITHITDLEIYTDAVLYKQKINSDLTITAKEIPGKTFKEWRDIPSFLSTSQKTQKQITVNLNTPENYTLIAYYNDEELPQNDSGFIILGEETPEVNGENLRTLIKKLTYRTPKCILVGKGVYAGNFELPMGYRLYGGFEGDSQLWSPTTLTDSSITHLCGDGKSSVVSILSESINGTEIGGFTLSNGKATMGGGIYVNDNDTVSVSNCIIRNNEAVKYGGGVRGAIVKNCLIENNYCEDMGGGADNVTLEGCIVRKNTSGRAGGVSNTQTIRNSIIHHNVATSLSGGIYNVDLVENSAIIANECQKETGGAHVFLANNTIIWGNQTNSTNLQLSQISEMSTISKNCAIQGLGNYGVQLHKDNMANNGPKFLSPKAPYDFRIYQDNCMDVAGSITIATFLPRYVEDKYYLYTTEKTLGDSGLITTGTTVTLKPKIDANEIFLRWESDNPELDMQRNTTLTFVMPKFPVYVTPIIVSNVKHKLTLVGATTEGGDYYAKEIIPIEAQIPIDFSFETWQGNALALHSIADTQNYQTTVLMPDSDISINAYCYHSYPITLKIEENAQHFDRIKLAWDDVGTNSKYDIFRASMYDNNLVFKKIKTVNAITYEDASANLLNGKTYIYQVSVRGRSTIVSNHATGSLKSKVDSVIASTGVMVDSISARDSFAVDKPAEQFNKKPSVKGYYDDPYTHKPKKISYSIEKGINLSKTPCDTIRVYTTALVPMLHTKHYKNRTTNSYDYIQSRSQTDSVEVHLRMKNIATQPEFKKEVNSTVVVGFHTPIIDSVWIADSDFGTDTVLFSLDKGDIDLKVVGRHFGIKTPKAYAEYRYLDKKGRTKIKTISLKVKSEHEEPLSLITKSKITDLKGNSSCIITVPCAKWNSRKPWKTGNQPDCIVISTGKGIAAIRIQIQP